MDETTLHMMDGSAASQTRQVAICCPRCGYDQRGVVATWINACPLEGTCSECGLELDWGEILQPLKHQPPWCIEFARPGAVLTAAIRTFLASLWPWWFWSRLRMSNRIRWKRLLLYIALLVVPLVVSYVLLQGAMAIHVRHGVEQEVLDEYQGLPRLIQTYQTSITEMNAQLGKPDAEAWITPSAVQNMQSGLAALQSAQSSQPSINQSYSAAVWEAVLFPFGSTSSGSINGVTSTHGYPAPRYLWSYALHLSSSRQFGWNLGGADWWYELDSIVRRFAFAAAVFVLFPISLLLLPISRRRATVRARHIFRALSHGLIIPVTLVIVAATAFALAFVDLRHADALLSIAFVVSHWGMIAFVVLWWWAVIGCYFRMPHALAVSCSLGFLCYLSVLAVCWFVWPKFALHMIGRLF